MAVQVAATSSFGFSTKTKYRYDVFLSFRGKDTRHSFTVPLYEALRRKGVNAFIDEKKLGKGEEISPTLLKAIEKSRISVIVFSTNYASSTWCLDELAYISLCKKQKNREVIPIFYKVDPMDVRYQTNSFGEAMAAHEENFRNDAETDRNVFEEDRAAHEDRMRMNGERLQKWRHALFEASSLSSAWLFKDGCEFRFIERIVEHVFAMLPPKPYHNKEHMVGLEPRIKQVISLLNKSDKGVCMFGIHGTGGIGKTTLAKAIYNSIFYHFDGACFLFDVNEASKKFQGIVHLQQKLLSDIVEEKPMRFGSADEGISKIKHRLSHKRILLVLDDVDEIKQLERLAGGYDWYGCGSKVIITTRNKQLLIAHSVERTYELEVLNDRDSLELFCSYAFHMSRPPKGYKHMSSHVVSYAKGLPLALKLIGANLANKNLNEWRSVLKQYDRILERTIHEVLKISYDCLQEGAKSIFLDIACFFKNELSDSIDEIVQACDPGARFYIEVLIDKSLITISDYGRLHMHDLIEQMGREIVQKQAISNHGKYSRLWNFEDVLKVPMGNSASSNIEGILFDPPNEVEVAWNGLAFKKMSNLRILIIRNVRFSMGPKFLPDSLRWLEWEGYPSTNLPPNFSPKKLIFVKLCFSPFKLKEPLKIFECLTCMNFSKCEFITEVPDMSQLHSVRKLLFSNCYNLIKVHDSVGSLSKLVKFDVSGCIKLTYVPRELNMPSLQVIDLNYCKSLDYFPHIVGKMDALKHVCADDSSIKELPPSFGTLFGLETLILTDCKSLRELPNNLLTLQNLHAIDLSGNQLGYRKFVKKLMQENGPLSSWTNAHHLYLQGCCLLVEDIHITLNISRNVAVLDLSGNEFVSLPECLKECGGLRFLAVSNCKRLRDIPELPSDLRLICAENCVSLTTESFGHLWSQAKKQLCHFNITMPSTTFPDWFNECCKGGTLSFRARGNFPHAAFAFELGKANTSSVHVSVSINGHKTQMRQSAAIYETLQGHLSLFDLKKAFKPEEWDRLDSFLDQDWNDVEIEVTCLNPHRKKKVKKLTPEMPIVNCGVYVYKETNMENVQFKSSILSLNVPTTSPKLRAVASPPNEQPPKKLPRKIKSADKGKPSNTERDEVSFYFLLDFT